ncbi:RluA family pseudouridine synthase [Lacihabitans sp. LS3-19]|uniref:RluA family pseudouridine synthase n=1 Tax=Lacihabitans sp. LS3-19 TaxID=2487335 RepID=UPI0020CB90A7|nr:RluA family pseudouridine synthase [Lacihabitans sp. LS3-19]
MIILEDSDLLIVNKPSGIASQSDNDFENTLIGKLSTVNELFIINRLDQRVSGLVIIAKNPKAAEILSTVISSRKITKTYRAIVAQKPKNEIGTLKNFILKKGTKAFISEKKTEMSKEAVLHYKVLKSSEKYHLLEIKLETGRFHQIRAQLSSIESPILGDLKYGYKRSSPDGSIFLQCCGLRFLHPITKEELNFEIEMPEVWKKYGF